MRDKILIVLLIIFLGINNLQLQSKTKKNWTETEQELWKLEKKYIFNYSEKNLTALTNFYHNKFVAWPEWSNTPIPLQDVKSATEKRSNLKIISYKIRPQDIVLFKSTAIVYYFVDLQIVNQKKEKISGSFRIIHTWINEEGKWKILGGMSAK